MKKKYIFNRWQIAYRMPGMEKYKLIPNPPWGWAADPFVIEYDGQMYLFAELFLYKTERNGVIGYCCYKDGRFTDWKVSMDRHWHLSYPNVFLYDDNIYMCPESYQLGEVVIYKLLNFPDKWEKVCTLLQNGKYADSTFLKYNNENYLFTYKHALNTTEGVLLLYKIEEGCKLSDPQIISEDISIARPGGKIIYEGDKIIRVSQDSKGGYGSGLVFSEIKSVWPQYEEKEIRRISASDIEGDWSKKFIGIHTYNKAGMLEVIDLKYTAFSIHEYLSQKRIRKVFLNKFR